MIAKRLIEEGTKVWNSIAQSNDVILWENVTFEIEEQFMKIACCTTRSLTEQVSSVVFLFSPHMLVQAHTKLLLMNRRLYVCGLD